MKNLQQKVCIFGAETVKTCAAASEYIFCFSKCVAAPRCISMFFQRSAASERYQWTTASKRKCAADIFFLCVAASRNISMFFDECAAASEKILTTASKRTKCATTS